MPADTTVPQRRLLLLVTLLMAGTAAIAGGLAAKLLSRDGMPALVSVPQPPACVAAATPPRQPDPTDALNAALGRPVAASPGLDTASLASLLAAPTPQPGGTASAAPAAALAPALPPLATTVAAPALPSGYELDLGYFLLPDHAAAFAARVQERGVPVQLLPLPDASGRVWTHVRTPPFAGSAQALAGAARIERDLGIQASLVAPAVPPPIQAGANRP